MDIHLSFAVDLTPDSLCLADNNLAGSLPTDLSELIALRGLWLFDNALTGTIPETIAGNPFLENVRLEGNPFLEGTLEFLCASPPPGLVIHADCSTIPCSCCQCT